MAYLAPKNDLVNRKVFGEHPKVVISLLNACLPLPVVLPIPPSPQPGLQNLTSVYDTLLQKFKGY